MIDYPLPDLPSYITNSLSSVVIDSLAVTNNNRDLFDIIGSIIQKINTQYPDLCIVPMRDKLEKITFGPEEYFIQELAPIDYKNNSLKSYSLIINLDWNLKQEHSEQNMLILRNDLDHSAIEVLRSFKTFLKATLLISNDTKTQASDSLIIKFKSTNKIRLVHKKLIDSHPSSLFSLKFYFNNNSSNVLYLAEVDYEHFSIVLKAMKGDLEAFNENKQLMDFLGLSIGPIAAIFLTDMNDEINKANDPIKEQIMKKNYERATAVNLFVTSLNSDRASVTSFKKDCVFVNTMQQYLSIKNLLGDNDNVVPIQVSYATFNTKVNNKNLDLCINREQILLNISIMDGAPIYVSFCDKISQKIYHSNRRLNPLPNTYESLRKIMLGTSCKPHGDQVISKIKGMDLSGGPEEYINTLLVICKSLVHKVWSGTITEYKPAKRNHIESPLNMWLLRRAYDKLDDLEVKANINIFSNYFLEPTYIKQICGYLNYNSHSGFPYTIDTVSYFGFLRIIRKN